MTIPTDPVKFARALARHVRNSHAVGKLIVGTAVRGVTGRSREARSVAPNSSSNPTTGSPVEHQVGAETDPYAGLPLPIAQWALLSSGDVVDMIEHCEADAVRAIGAYEETHRRRRLVVQAVKNRLAQ